MIKKIAIAGLTLSIVALLVASGVFSGAKLGSYTSSFLDTAEGYKVDGTAVIDGSGNLDGSVTSDTGTFSSTLTVSGETNLSTLVKGGSTATSSATTTWTAANMCDNAYWATDAGGSAVTLTTASTTALIADCIPNAGDSKVIFFENTSSGAEDITITAGGSIDLIEPSGGDVIIQQNEDARIEILNVDGTNVKIYVTSMQAAD